MLFSGVCLPVCLSAKLVRKLSTNVVETFEGDLSNQILVAFQITISSVIQIFDEVIVKTLMIIT